MDEKKKLKNREKICIEANTFSTESGKFWDFHRFFSFESMRLKLCLMLIVNRTKYESKLLRKKPQKPSEMVAKRNQKTQI